MRRTTRLNLQLNGVAEDGRLAGRRISWQAIGVVFPLILALAVFLTCTAYQLQLPGLHYDEAKEAGVNAMQLLTGQPVTAFRGATIAFGPWRIPLMVQDYIGNLNVLLAVPFLAAGGVNTIALRALPLFLAALTLFLSWKVAGRLGGPWAAGATALLLAVNPSFVFWSRQGIFVTNITALFFMAALWFGILWWQQRRSLHLVLMALCCGLGIYAKLLYVWAAVALVVVGLVALLWERRGQIRGSTPLPRWRDLVVSGSAFALPLTPLIIFNIRTGGTLTSVFGHLGKSYYGVDNSAYGRNLLVRLDEVVTLLRGDHFWYLGEVYANALAPWLLLSLLVLSLAAWLVSGRRHAFSPFLPLGLLLLIVLQSAFTISDLFITHFILVAPLIPLASGLALGELLLWAKKAPRSPAAFASAAGIVLALVWAVTDGSTVMRYHRILTISGGYSAHSDAIYRLAGYLDKEGYRAPVALDWGIDAPVRFLTRDRVRPVDVFGFESMSAPDPGFAKRVGPYLEDWQTIYVGHPPDKAIFKGRLEAIAGWAADRGLRWLEQIRLEQRSGEPVFVVYRFLK